MIALALIAIGLALISLTVALALISLRLKELRKLCQEINDDSAYHTESILKHGLRFSKLEHEIYDLENKLTELEAELHGK